MADNYLEYAREKYEKRKAEWLKRKTAGRAKKITAAQQGEAATDDKKNPGNGFRPQRPF